MMILMSHKVRSKAPQVPPLPPAESEQVVEPARKRGRPPGSRNECVKELYPCVLGIDLSRFANVPVELRNRFAGNFAAALAECLKLLDTAYENEDYDVGDLISQGVPEVTYALARALNEQVLTEERGYLGPRICCSELGCGGSLEYQGDVKRTVKTKLGDLSFSRAYYHGGCGHSVCPLDVRLGIDGMHGTLPDFQELLAMTAASMSFPEGVSFIGRFLPTKVSLKHHEDVTATVGRDLSARQQQEVEQMESSPSQAASRNGDLEDRVAFLGVDGGFCRVRDHSEPSKEFKLAVFAEIVAKKDGSAADDPESYSQMFTLKNKSFVGHLSSPEPFYQHVQAEYFRRGDHKAKTLHGVADGGAWCLPRMALVAQEGQELSLVLDWFHAAERVADAANAAHPNNPSQAAEWKTSVKDALWNGNLETFFARLQDALAEAVDDNKTVLAEHLYYFQERKSVLRYKECRERRLPVGSGAIEGGIRFVGKDRLHGTGMRWNMGGAENILQLRCAKYSDRFDEFVRNRKVERMDRYRHEKAAWLRAA